MHEPAFPSFIFAGAIFALLGPVFGPFVMLLFAAVMGGLLAMSKVVTPTRMEGVKFLALAVGISLALSGFAVWMVEKYTPIPGNIALMPVAFVIALSRDYLLVLIERILERFASYLGSIGRQKGGE